MPLGQPLITTFITLHLVNKRCLILIFSNFHFFQKIQFLPKISIVQTICFVLSVWTLRVSHQIDSKMTSTWSEGAFGIPFHYKNAQLTFSQQTLRNSEFLKFPLSPKNQVFAKIGIIQTILICFYSMNFTF